MNEASENVPTEICLPTEVNMIDPRQIASLKHAQTIAFIGLSDKPERYSYQVARYFQNLRYKIVPINPMVQEVLGENAYPSLLDVPHNIAIDIVDIFRRSEEVVPHMHEIIKRGDIKTVWLAEGVKSAAAEQLAQDHDLYLVPDRCMMKVSKAAEGVA